jgi:alkylation response protein AidB-like acyl-CoA dehydrogenase
MRFRYERLMIAALLRRGRAPDRRGHRVRSSVQFGAPIIENQAIGHTLADSLTELAARLMTYGWPRTSTPTSTSRSSTRSAR